MHGCLQVWESNMAGDYGSNAPWIPCASEIVACTCVAEVKGMQYAIVSLMDGQKNGGSACLRCCCCCCCRARLPGKYRILFSNALPPESEMLAKTGTGHRGLGSELSCAPRNLWDDRDCEFGTKARSQKTRRILAPCAWQERHCSWVPALQRSPGGPDPVMRGGAGPFSQATSCAGNPGRRRPSSVRAFGFRVRRTAAAADLCLLCDVYLTDSRGVCLFL